MKNLYIYYILLRMLDDNKPFSVLNVDDQSCFAAPRCFLGSKSYKFYRRKLSALL